MILTFIFYILAILIGTVSIVLPTWQIWPQVFLDGLAYFFSHLASLNFLFPVDTLLTVLLFWLSFEVLYFTAKLIMKVFNFFRGTGSGLDI
jgi:hypothetical protein